MKFKWAMVCTLLAVSMTFADQAAAKRSGRTATAKHHRAVKAADGPLMLASSVAMIVDQESGKTLYARKSDVKAPIASITKLMTAMVVLDANLPLDEPLTIAQEDVDLLRGSGSRLRVGTTLTRSEMLQLALMSSENRAAAALARTYPGGTKEFVAAMNHKAAELGMANTTFVDSTGLRSENASTAEDLVKMVRAGYHYDLIREMTTREAYDVTPSGRNGRLAFHNTNALVKSRKWDIGLSKTGFINEAGRCLVMQAKIATQPVIIVLLDSWGKYTRIADANRIKKWLETSSKSKKWLENSSKLRPDNSNG